MRVLANEGAEFRQPPLERAVKTLLVCELLLDALEAALEPLDDGELGVNGQPQGAHFGRLGGRDVVVELLDEAHDHLGAFPVKFVELPAGEHAKTASEEKTGCAG